MDVTKTIIELSNQFGVSGCEQNIARIAAGLIAPMVDEVIIDRFGNLVAKRFSNEYNAPTLLLDAHLDQIGAMVTEITAEGFLRFTPIGGIDQRVMLGQTLLVRTRCRGLIKGIVATIPPHLLIHMDATTATPTSEMLVDLGRKADEVKNIVHPGDYITFADESFEMADGLICGKAMDDRACFVSILYALELIKDSPIPCNLIITGTTKEEIGFVGASVCSYRYPADLAVSVDVCHAETEDSLPKDDVFPLKGGPVIFTGANSLPAAAALLRQIAQKNDIPTRLAAVAAESYINAWTMQVAGTGTATVGINLPLKYMHTPVEIVSLQDIMAISRLLACLITEATPQNLCFGGDVTWKN
ncbi:M42 family peptidase [Oscillospiraceae bacterium LTW-04]|nr:M42 family peptidase [Oscillospiraceae bacterium MB24-C1]